MTTEELNCWEMCSPFSWRRTIERECPMQIHSYERVKPEEVRSEVCNLRCVDTETFGVLSVFGVTQCYGCSKIKGVIINCNSAWRIFNKIECQIQNS
jgi:hypothetical protein